MFVESPGDVPSGFLKRESRNLRKSLGGKYLGGVWEGSVWGGRVWRGRRGESSVWGWSICEGRGGEWVRSKIFKVAPLRFGTEVLGWIARCDKLACIDLLFSKFKMLWRLGIVWDSSRKVKFTLGILSCSFLFFLWSGRNSLTKSSCIK